MWGVTNDGCDWEPLTCEADGGTERWGAGAKRLEGRVIWLRGKVSRKYGCSRHCWLVSRLSGS